jgi:hypothetical protein
MAKTALKGNPVNTIGELPVKDKQHLHLNW